jgi:hypothetical protein
MVAAYETRARAGGLAGLGVAGDFFMDGGDVKKTMRKIAHKLDQLQIPYAVVGGMALVLHGQSRTTVDVNILVTFEGLKAAHESLEGLGYVAPFAGSKNLRDTETGVRIEFLVAGNFPGDGKPKPVAFPDPSLAATEIDGIRVAQLPRFIELKLASGLTGGAARLKDFADVVALIDVLKLPESFADQLHDYVRPKFVELWQDLATNRTGDEDR